mgnify:CR=1 FL=1
MYIKELSDNDFKKYINYDSNCITQVISFVPDNIMLAQACEIFFYYIKSLKNLKIKSPPIFFLSILYGSSNIQNILDQISKSPKKVLVHCCANEKYNSIKITSKEIRLKLSKIAIASLDSLL